MECSPRQKSYEVCVAARAGDAWGYCGAENDPQAPGRDVFVLLMSDENESLIL